MTQFKPQLCTQRGGSDDYYFLTDLQFHGAADPADPRLTPFRADLNPT